MSHQSSMGLRMQRNLFGRRRLGRLWLSFVVSYGCSSPADFHVSLRMLHDRQCRYRQIPCSHGYPLELTSMRITAPSLWDQLKRLPCPQEHLFYTQLIASQCYDRYKPRSMSLPLLSLDSVCKCALLLMLWSPKARFKKQQGRGGTLESDEAKTRGKRRNKDYSQEQHRNNTFQSDTPAGRRIF